MSHPLARTKEGFLWTPTTKQEGLVTAAAAPTTKLTSPLKAKSQYDVIVIGAGFTGLIAARDLSQTHHLSVLLLEARDRIGGRTWTANVLGEEVEMGGTWVHWDQPHVYSQLQRYGLQRHLKTSAGTATPARQTFRDVRGEVGRVNGEIVAEALERVARGVFTVDGLGARELMPFPHEPLREPALWKRYDGLSVKERLDQVELEQRNGDGGILPRERAWFESNVSTFGSAPVGQIAFVEALRWYVLGGCSMAGVFEKAGMYKLGKGGMTSFARAILDDFRGDMLFGTAVAEIRQGLGAAAGVVVRTADGRRLRAKTVVSTIPLNCLNDVTFDPPLSPIRQSAIATGHINQGAKIHFKLRDTQPGWFHTADGNGDSSFVFAFSDHNGTQASGPSGTWCIGFGYNGHLTDKTDSRHILARFRRDVLPSAEVEAYATHDWMNDPYAKGVWACWGPGGSSRYLEALQKPHGRVVFASADWADGWRGFVDGAIERGQNAVREVLQVLDGSLERVDARL